jgi:hypothetical protein
MKYRKKPVVIDAHLYDGDFEAVFDWAALCKCLEDDDILTDIYYYVPKNQLYINTPEGDIHVSVGDYIICDVGGNFYPCMPDIFEATYERVEE